MRSFFLQKPLLRLLTPLVVGSIAYLLILLVNNNILQLQAYFLGAELYFCLGLALLMQEGLWWILRPIGKLSWSQAVGVVVRRRTIGAIVLIVTLVASAVWAYYSFALGFAPSSGELLMFCGVFTVLGGLLISLKVSHSLLLLDNEEALAAEAAMKEHIAADFNQFKQGINPDLLFVMSFECKRFRTSHERRMHLEDPELTTGSMTALEIAMSAAKPNDKTVTWLRQRCARVSRETMIEMKEQEIMNKFLQAEDLDAERIRENAIFEKIRKIDAKRDAKSLFFDQKSTLGRPRVD